MNEKLIDVVPKGLLWHYTDFGGLKGILMDGRMRASNIAYLNDAEEFKHTVSIVIDAVAKFCSGIPFYRSEQVNEYIFRVMMQSTKAYVSSFSLELDDLSQWRGYAKSSPSFSIGFVREQLEALGHRVVDCEYNLAVQTWEIEKAVETARDKFNEGPVNSDPGMENSRFYNSLLCQLCIKLSKVAVRNKSPKFINEKEVRMIVFPSAPLEVDYITARSMVVPFVDWPWRNEAASTLPPALSTIVVGPSPHQREIIAVTRKMCLQRGLIDRVYASEVPYRF